VLFNMSTIDLSSPTKTNTNVSLVTRDISCVCLMTRHSKIDNFDPSTNDVIHFHILTDVRKGMRLSEEEFIAPLTRFQNLYLITLK
jgi:hypothetical protein